MFDSARTVLFLSAVGASRCDFGHGLVRCHGGPCILRVFFLCFLSHIEIKGKEKKGGITNALVSQINNIVK